MNRPVCHLKHNAIDNEMIGGTREPDGTIIVSAWSLNAGLTSKWFEIARWNPNGRANHADGLKGGTWTPARIATVEQVLLLMD